MNDEECRNYILETLRDYNINHAAMMMHIGQIRDELHRRSNEEINEDQLINCGISLANDGYIRIAGHEGIRGWIEAIILPNGISHLESRSGAEVT